MRNLVLWGHDCADYREMFDLTDDDLRSKIFEYGSGATSFNAEMHQKGHTVISADDMFSLPKQQVVNYFEKSFKQMLHEVAQVQHQFNWSKYGDFNGLIAKRQRGMQHFFDDYTVGQHQKRYQGCKVLQLPFPDFSFNIALSSHFLFANLAGQDETFHVQAINELARIATEVRIFPLIDRVGNLSSLIGEVMLQLQQQNLGVEIRAVPYSLQSKGNAMLRVWAQECKVE